MPANTVKGAESLAEALSLFQQNIPPIKKDKHVSAGAKQYDYAQLETITGIVLPLLAKHGLAWSCTPDVVEGVGFALRCRLAFRGEVLEGVYPIQSGAPQQVGSALTYARRYALCAMTGVAPEGDDDDAQAAQAAYRPRRAPQQPSQVAPRQHQARVASEEQQATVREWAGQLGWDGAQLDQMVSWWQQHVYKQQSGPLTSTQAPAFVAYMKERHAQQQAQAEADGTDSISLKGGAA